MGSERNWQDGQDGQAEATEADLWFKVVGMLMQNWAIVRDKSADEVQPGSGLAGVEIVFFDDHGDVFDTLDYPSHAQAEHALAFNGFTPVTEQPDIKAAAGLPRFPLRRPSSSRRPVYSSGEYWRQPPGIEHITQRRRHTPAGLQRFVEAQAPVMDTVMEELQAGRKETHWMWFVFPQLGLLGHSPKARRYGIVDLDEAVHYLHHLVLGPRLHQCFELVLQHPDKSAEAIFGHVDAMKLRSCATLFHWASATQHTVFKQALKVFFDGKADQRTLELL